MRTNASDDATSRRPALTQLEVGDSGEVDASDSGEHTAHETAPSPIQGLKTPNNSGGGNHSAFA